MNSLELDGDALAQLAAVYPGHIVKGIEKLLECVWESSKYPVALYFRGSVRRPHRTKPPLDVDLYFAVLRQTPSDSPAVDLCLKLHASFPGLPRLDLSVFERANVLNPEIRQMTRLILLHDSSFVAGEDIKSLLPDTPLDSECAELIWIKQTEIVTKKVRGLSTAEFATAPLSLQAYLCSSVAKSALRLVMPAFILRGGFTRDPLRCAAYISKCRPDLERAVKTVSESAGSKGQLDMRAIRESAGILLRELGWENKRDLAHANAPLT